jgi:hypothetical protein
MREAGKTGVVHKLQALGRSRLEGAGCEAGCAKKNQCGPNGGDIWISSIEHELQSETTSGKHGNH